MPDDKILTVHERMIAIIAALPAIGKNQRNTQQNFMFRGHDDVMKALTPLLAEHGVFIVPHVLERQVAQRTTGNNKVMFEVNLHVAYTFFGAAGDSFEGSAWGEGTDMGDKSTSKAMTMAFKSVLSQAFAISTEEAGDPDATTAADTVRPTPPLADDEAIEAYLVAVGEAGFARTAAEEALYKEAVTVLEEGYSGTEEVPRIPVAVLATHGKQLAREIAKRNRP